MKPKCCLGCWKTTAPLGPWCITWDIPNWFDSEEDRLLRSVIAMWVLVPGGIAGGALEFIELPEYKDKRLGRVRLWM